MKIQKIIVKSSKARPFEQIKFSTIDKAKKWIKQNIEHKMTIKMIAEQVFMNPTYFSQYFKTQTGETVLDYVTRVRIARVKSLLVSSDLKLQEITERVGYQDAKYVSRLFKQHVGRSPSKYREQYVQPKNNILT